MVGAGHGRRGAKLTIHRWSIGLLAVPVAAITGAALIAYGIPNGLLGESRISDEDIDNETAYRLGAWAPLAVGLGLLPYGLVVWRASVADAEDTSGAPRATATALVPFTSVEGRHTTFGALWGGRF